MRQLLEATLDNGMSAAHATWYILPVVLALAAGVQLLRNHRGLRNSLAALMAATWVVVVLYCLLAFIESVAYDKLYFFGVLIFPLYMAPSLVVATIGLVLRLRRRRD